MWSAQQPTPIFFSFTNVRYPFEPGALWANDAETKNPNFFFFRIRTRYLRFGSALPRLIIKGLISSIVYMDALQKVFFIN